MGENLRFGIGKLSVDGVVYGELQDATISWTGDMKEIWGDDKRFPVDIEHGKRAVKIKAKYARINAADMEKILGGVKVGDKITIGNKDKLGFFSLTLQNPSDGSDIEVTFPKCKSSADLEMVLTQDDFVIIEPEFQAVYDENGDVMTIEFDKVP